MEAGPCHVRANFILLGGYPAVLLHIITLLVFGDCALVFIIARKKLSVNIRDIAYMTFIGRKAA